MNKNKTKSFLLGLGLDARDGHKRITRGGNFYLFGGSKKTHEFMQESCLKFNEELKKRCKTIETISYRECRDIFCKIGLEKGSGQDQNNTSEGV